MSATRSLLSTARAFNRWSPFFLDVLDAGVVQGRAIYRLSSILRFGTVVDFDVAVGRELMLGGNGMAV